MDKKPGGTCTNQNPVVRAWGERCKAVQHGEQELAHVIVFVDVSALGPALLPKHGLTPSLMLALLSCQNAFIPLARDYDIYWKVCLSLEYQINFF